MASTNFVDLTTVINDEWLNDVDSLVYGAAANGLVSFLDEDDFASDSAAAVASQQSIKAYISTNLASSGVVKLASGTAAAAASIEITGLSDSYAAYLVVLRNYQASNDGTNLLLQVSTNGTVWDDEAADYQGAGGAWATSGSAALGSGITNGALVSFNNGNDTGEAGASHIWIFDPGESSYRTIITAQGGMERASGLINHFTASFQRLTAQAEVAIRLIPSAGTIDLAEYTVYGLPA